MILGRSVIHWVILAFVAICVFFLAEWLIPLLFGAIGVDVPKNIVVILSALIALGCVFGGYSYRSGRVA
ncbi:MAG: hypothetical protein NVS4B6_23650 [Mycobacterium sp.]